MESGILPTDDGQFEGDAWRAGCVCGYASALGAALQHEKGKPPTEVCLPFRNIIGAAALN
jgi:hypothetical protein